ncbi:MAG: permease [Candidatus Sumerlaeota bacterium]|nr:permease [Candidatus Sumerlaeota bacterium]
MGAFLLKFNTESWQVLLDFAPWLLMGMLIAGIVHVALPRGFIHRRFGKRGFSDVIKASALGVPLPLCSCGVIPAAIGLKKDGASNGASVAFLISTPQTGVDSILVSASFLGLPFAIFKVFSALITGIVGGMAVNWFERNDPMPEPPMQCCADNNWNGANGRGGWFKEIFRFGFGRLLREVYVWIIVGVLVAGLLGALIPKDFFKNYAWMQGIGGMLVVVAIAIPMYVCASASVPIAAELVHAGLPAGAALVFLIAGPASNIATIGAIYKTFGRRVTIIYLTTVTVMSILLGWAFQWVIAVPHHAMAGHEHIHGGVGGAAALFTYTCVAIMLALIAWFAASDIIAAFRRLTPKPQSKAQTPPTAGEDQPKMEQLELRVEGMTCEHCAAHVKRALESVPGVTQAVVDLKNGRATITGEALRAIALTEAVTKAGYKAILA